MALNLLIPSSSRYIIFPNLSLSALFSWIRISLDWFLNKSSILGISISFPFLSVYSISDMLRVRLFNLLLPNLSSKEMRSNLKHLKLNSGVDLLALLLDDISL